MADPRLSHLEDQVAMLTRNANREAGDIRSNTAAIDQLRMEMNQRFDAVENRLDSGEQRLTAVEGRLTAVEDRLTAVEDRLTAIEGRLTALERLETNVAQILELLQSR